MLIRTIKREEEKKRKKEEGSTNTQRGITDTGKYIHFNTGNHIVLSG